MTQAPDTPARLIRAVLDAAHPGRAVERAWPGDLLADAPVALLAVGKGSVAMAEAAIGRLGGRVTGGLVVGVPERVAGFEPGPRVRVLAADHPLPTERNLAAAEAVERFARSIGEGDTALVLISGGASAQLTAPWPSLKLADVRATTDALLRAGATIDELNAVRKHLDRLKGGRLAALLAPSPVVVLVVSDVMGDRLDVISSGPAAPDPTTYADALSVLAARGVRAPEGVTEHLRAGARGERPETPKPGDAVFARVTHRVIAHNAGAVDAAARELAAMGLRVETRTGVVGEAVEVGRELGRLVRAAPAGTAFAWGGETTVRVGDAPGKGGRNQELALGAAREISGLGGALVVSFGTDGIDGPTDAAGGVVTGETAERLAAAGVSLEAALARHDAYPALEAAGGLIRTGPTGTNVNDVMIGVRLG